MLWFSLLKGLETQPWPGLCNLFISFQARLCELIHGGWGKEAGRDTNTQTENKPRDSSLFGGGKILREMDWGVMAEERDWGYHYCVPGLGLWEPHLGKLLSLSARLAPWERRRSGKGMQQAQTRLAVWRYLPGVSSYPLPHPLHQRTHGLPWSPGELQVSWVTTLSSYRSKRARAFGSSELFAFDLHTSAYPRSRGPQSKDVKWSKINSLAQPTIAQCARLDTLGRLSDS